MNNEYYMEYALNLARMCKGQTSPNPCVGAVLVKNNQVIGIGSHLFAGREHAEVHAINMAKDNACGATLFVTLEPCSHFGKTPPCIEAIINARVSKVVVAMLDLNPMVRGNGIAKLKAAGIEVIVGVLEEQSYELNQDFFYSITHQKPYITLKCGMSLDGKLATSTLESKWITSPNSRYDAHLYRHTHDAILTGINSIINDDSQLTTRLNNGGKNPVRIILDSSLKIAHHTRNVITDKTAQTWVVCTNLVKNESIELLKHHPHVKVIKMNEDVISIPKLLNRLYTMGITSILVEGGSKIHASFLESRAFNQLVLYIAPQLIGGANAPQFFGANGFASLNDSIKLKLKSSTQIDNDLKLVYVVDEVKQCLPV